ncbi:competence protein CoiA [Planococcus sp. YIM B11945]|uniref:competence protein CoiA n=1 Tax=Planococcus sp. YIM B11945 TaxID=3435410 RepID=UPI003D7D12B0
MIGILLALTSEKQLINLARPYERKELLAMRKGSLFYCPGCNAPVRLKVGEIKIPHFAHETRSLCETYSEPESTMHLQGKSLLHQFFTRKNFSVELEKYLPPIRQRADLLVEGQTAVEFQCSQLPAEHIRSRTEGYNSLGIQTIWINGLQETINEGIQLLTLPAWKQEVLKKQKNRTYLIGFQPEQDRFYYCSNLLYVSGNRWIGKVKSLSASKQVFPFAVPKRLTFSEFTTAYTFFLQARKKFIKAQFYPGNKFRNPYWRSCYELKLDPSDLPLAIGVPVPNAQAIPLHAVLWQLQVLEAADKGSSFSSRIHLKQSLARFDWTPEAESLAAAYVEIYHSLKSVKENTDEFLETLYRIYCKYL